MGHNGVSTQDNAEMCLVQFTLKRFFVSFILHSRYHAIPINIIFVRSFWALSSHRGRVTHMCIGNITRITSDNVLPPGRQPSHYLNQCWNVVNWTLRNELKWILIEIQTFSFKIMHMKMSSAKWRPFYLGLNALTHSMCKTWFYREYATDVGTQVQ